MVKRKLPFIAMVIAASLLARGSDVNARTKKDLMQGFPPLTENAVNLSNFMAPPYNRWAFQHMRELVPTRSVYRGEDPVRAVEHAPLPLEDLKFTLHDKQQVDLLSWLEESKTDSFVVMHRGRIVYERYLNDMEPHRPHQMFSATKSLIGMLTLGLIYERKIDPDKPISHYVPELKTSGFGDATIQQVLDMTTSLRFDEDYVNPDADVYRYGAIFGIGGYPSSDAGRPQSIYRFLPTLPKGTEAHGDAFHYITPNTDVLAWVNSRVSGMGPAELLETKVWKHLGAERDAYFWLAQDGTAMAGGGLNMTARDAARFGQMILQKGYFNGKQILPSVVAERILQPGNPDVFTRFHKDPWYQHIGYAYHDQWWTFDNPHLPVCAIGIHGQFIYLDTVTQMVIVKQSSHQDAEGVANEIVGPQIWHQISQYLLSLK
ncbi:MAG: serine hydrolase [Pseudomonadota bacterium]